MAYTVSITSQGQMSIPAPIRRQFGLDQVRRARVTVTNDAIIVHPIKDIDALMGSLATKKRLTRKQERKLLEEGWAHGLV